MPIYTYKCPRCEVAEEHIVKLAERDSKVILCGVCGERMPRQMDVPVIGKSAFQMSAIMSDGRKVPGHFGKAAKLDKGRK